MPLNQVLENSQPKEISNMVYLRLCAVYLIPLLMLGYNLLDNNSIFKSLQTQSIYLPNHPFKTNQQVTLTIPSTDPSYYLSVSNSPDGNNFNLPFSGNNQTVYVIKKWTMSVKRWYPTGLKSNILYRKKETVLSSGR